MSVFFNNAITDDGRTLWPEIQLGGTFTPTKIVMGKGYMPSGKTVRTMTAVADSVKELSFNKKKALTGGDFLFGAMFTNQDVQTAFYFRELALYAKVVRQDTSETSEVLYSYGNAADNAELIPAYSSGSAVERQIDIISYIGNDATVNLTIGTGIYVLKNEYDTDMATINGKMSVTDKTVLGSGTILAWANSCTTNASKFILTSTHVPSDIPLKSSGFLEVLVQGTYKTVRFTPFGFKDGVKYSRDITNQVWAFDWSTDISSGIITVYVDNTNGNDANSGLQSSEAKKTISSALTAFKGARSISIVLSPGTYNEGTQLYFGNYSRVNISRASAGTVTINGALYFHACSYVQVENITINGASYNGRALSVLGGTAIFSSVTVIGQSGYDNTVLDICRAYINGSTFTGGNSAIISWGSSVGIENVTINSGINVGIYAHGSTVTVSAVTNNATVAQTAINGSQIFS